MENSFRELAVERVYESALNPRKRFDEEKIRELAESIKGVGVIEPIVVREKRGKQGHEIFEIIAGSRRHRAAKLAGLALIPAVVKDLDDAQALEIMVIENNQREDVNPLEEAQGYKSLLEHKYSLEVLAAKIGRSHKYIYDRLKLLELIPAARELLLAAKISAGHAILLARLKPDDQKRAIEVKGVGYYHEGGCFQFERGLFDEEDDDAPRDSGAGVLKKYAHFKARSVRELEAWIDHYVRFEKKTPVDPMLFPETAATLTKAVEEKEKVVQVTHNLQTPQEAKEGNTERIYHASSWKRADGSPGHKACEKSVLGVVVIGAERGKAYRVCLSTSDCKVHWAREKAARARMRSRFDRGDSAAVEKLRAKQKAEEGKRAAEEAAWEKAKPAILEACAKNIRTAALAPLYAIIQRHFNGYADWNDGDFKKATRLFGAPKSVEDLARLTALTCLLTELDGYDAREEFPNLAKQIGVSVAAILRFPDPGAPARKKVQTSAKVSGANAAATL